MQVMKCKKYQKQKFWERVKNKITEIRNNLERDFAIKAFAGKVSTTELVNRIFSFCEVYCDKTLFPYQEQFSKRVIRSVLENDGEQITALFSRQSGKSETIADTCGGLMIILPVLANMPMFLNDVRFQMFKDGIHIGIFAPSQRQAQITYGRIKSRIQSKPAMAVLTDPEFNLSFTTSNGQTVALSNGSFATAISASDGSSIEGESFMLIICEECQDISNFKIRKSIHPMGAAYNATIVKIGTATTFKGDFYEAIKTNKAELPHKGSLYRNHFEYDCDVASKYNPKYAAYVEKEKKRLGENSDEFQMSYKLKWIIERGMFIDIPKFEANNLELGLDTVDYDMQANHVAGIDIGGAGDSTVISIVEVDWSMPVIMESRTDEETGEEQYYTAYNTYLVAWLEIKNMPNHEEQYPIITDFLSHYRISRVVCDATKESAVAHRLGANLKCEVIPYIFTQKSKSELYKHLDREICSGRARVAGSEAVRKTHEYKAFIEQMGDLQKGWSGSNMVVAHPDEKGAHDDFPDSWALAVYGAASVAETDNTETRRNTFTQKTPYELKAAKAVNRITARRRR